jgi:hypothetical protein
MHQFDPQFPFALRVPTKELCSALWVCAVRCWLRCGRRECFSDIVNRDFLQFQPILSISGGGRPGEELQMVVQFEVWGERS